MPFIPVLAGAPAAPAAFSDDFNRANGALGASWVSIGTQSQPSQPEIVGNEVVGGSASISGVRWANPTNTDNQFSEATWLAGTQYGVSVAMPAFTAGQAASAAGTWYTFRRTAGSTVAISQKDAGASSFTNLTTANVTLVSGDVIRLEYEAGVLTAKVNGATVATHTPGAPITGQRYVGWGINSTAFDGVALMDDWSGGDYATPTGPTAWGTVRHRWAGAVTDDAFTVACKTSDSGGDIRLVAATDAGFTTPIYSSGVTPDAQHYAKLTVSGLAENTPYFYAFEFYDADDDEWVRDTDRQGTVSTFPTGAPDFNVAHSSCMDPTVTNSVLTRIEEWAPLLYIHQGDFHYDNNTNSTDDEAARDEWRGNYDQALNPGQNAVQSSLFSSLAMAYTWDDHDYCGSNSDGTAPGRVNAAMAYRQCVPHYPLPATDGVGIWQTFVIGRVRFFLLDCRSQRSPVGNTDNASKTMLGAEQKQWLKDTMLAADESAFVIASSVNWTAVTPDSNDNWAQYQTERTELVNWFTANGFIDSIFIISGDSHGLAADDGTNSAGGIPEGCGSAIESSPPSIKGGPWSQGSDAGNSHYGRVAVNDLGVGNGVSIGWTGREDVAGVDTQILSLTAALAEPFAEHAGAAAMVATSALVAGGVKERPGAAALSAASVLSAGGVKERPGAVNLVATSTLAPAPTIGKTAGWRDDFSTSLTNRYYIDAGVALSGAELEIPAATNYPKAIVAEPLDLTNSTLTVQVTQRPNVSNGSTETLLIFYPTTGGINFGNHADLLITGSNYVCRETNGWVHDDTTVAYDGATWLRIRHNGTSLYWEKSFDGETWSTLRTKVTPAHTYTRGFAALAAGNWNSAPSPGSAKFDNLNIPQRTGAVAFTAASVFTANAARRDAHTLVERFDAFDSGAWWRSDASRVTFDGTLNITPQDGTNTFPALESANDVRLTGSSVTVHMAQIPPTPSTGDVAAELQFILPHHSDWVSIGVAKNAAWGGGAVYVFREGIDWSSADTTYPDYIAVQEPWLRIRHDGTSLYWETSADGVTWTTRRTKVTPANDYSIGRVVLNSGSWNSGTGLGTSKFDNLNLPPVTGSVALVAASALTADGTTGGTQSGAAALSAAAVLTAAAIKERPGAAALSAAAVFTADGVRTTAGAVNLVATSTLVAAGVRTTAGAVAFVATATLTAAAIRERLGAATLVAQAVLTTDAVRAPPGSVAFTAAAVLTAAGVRTRDAAAALSAAHVLTADGVRTTFGVVNLVATATLTAAPDRTTFGAVAFTATAVLSASGVRTTAGAVAFTATATLTAAGVRERLASVTLAAAHVLTTDGTRDRPAAVALSAASVLTTDGVRTTHAAAALVAQAVLTAPAGDRTTFGAVALVEQAVLTAGPVRTTFGAVALVAAHVLTAAGVRERPATVALTATATLTAAGVRDRPAAVALAATAVLTADGVRTRDGAAAFTAQAVLTAAGDRTTFGAVAFVAQAVLTVPAGDRTTFGAVAMVATSTLTAAGVRERFGAAALSAASVLTADGVRTAPGAVAFVATAVLSTDGVRVRLGAAALAAAHVLTADGVRTAHGAVALVAQATLTAGPVRTTFGAVSLVASAVLAAAGVRERFGAVALSAAHVLTAGGVRTAHGTANLTTAHVLTVGGVRTAHGAVALAAESVLAVTAYADRAAAAALVEQATLTATGGRTTFGAVAMVEQAVLTATGAVTTTGAVALVASAVLSAAVGAVPGGVALVATTVLSTGGVRTAPGAVAMAANAALGAAGVRTTAGAVAMVAQAVLSAQGVRTAPGAVALSAAHVLTAAGVRTTAGAVALAAVATLSTDGVRTRPGAVALTAAHVLTVAGVRERFGAAVLVATHVLTAGAAPVRDAAVALEATSVLEVAGIRVQAGAVVLTTEHILDVPGVRERGGAVEFVAAAVLTAAATPSLQAATALVATAVMSAAGTITRHGAAVLEADAVLAVAAERLRHAAAVLVASADLTVSRPESIMEASVVLEAEAVLRTALMYDDFLGWGVPIAVPV